MLLVEAAAYLRMAYLRLPTEILEALELHETRNAAAVAIAGQRMEVT